MPANSFPIPHSPGERTLDYVERHILLQGLTSALGSFDTLAWTESPPEEWPDISPNLGDYRQYIQSVSSALYNYDDSTGSGRRMRLVKMEMHDGRVKYAVSSTTPGLNRELAGFGPPILVSHDEHIGRYSTMLDNGVAIHSNTLLRDHQLNALKAHGTALDSNSERCHDLIVFATGTGKSFIVSHALQALGRHGVIVVPDEMLAHQFRKELEEIGIDQNNIVTSSELLDDVPKIEGTPFGISDLVQKYTSEKILIVTHPHLENLAPHIQHSQIAIDEAHELEDSSHVKAMMQKNDVLAITATPTTQLIDLFGEAKLVIDMYRAIHNLKAFRDLRVKVKQVGNETKGLEGEALTNAQQKNDAAIITEAVAGYFGRVEFMPEQQGEEEGNTYEYMRNSRIYYHNRKNIVFARRPEIIQGITDAYNSIFTDGKVEINGEDITSTIRAEVVYRRNMHTLTCLLEKEEYTLPEDIYSIDPAEYSNHMKRLREKGLWIDEKDIDLQAEAQDALRQNIANQITISAVSIITGKPEKDIRRDLKAGKLQEHLKDFANKIAKNHAKESPNHELEKIYEGLSDPQSSLIARLKDVMQSLPHKKELLADLQHGRLDQIVISSDDIDLNQFTSNARYAVAMHEDMGEEARLKIATDAKAGRIIHIVNRNQFERGYDDPYLYHLQRVVESLSQSVISATQMGGRPVRAKDGIAAAHEIVGANINMNGTRGVDKHFSLRDVISPFYVHTVLEFMSNFHTRDQDNTTTVTSYRQVHPHLGAALEAAMRQEATNAGRGT